MKKYLLTSAAALAFCGLFTSCTHDLGNAEEAAQKSVMKTYEQAFITAFGQPDPNQEWGFGTSTVATTRGTRTYDDRPAQPSFRSNPGIPTTYQNSLDDAKSKAGATAISDGIQSNGVYYMTPGMNAPDIQNTPLTIYFDGDFSNNAFTGSNYQGGKGTTYCVTSYSKLKLTSVRNNLKIYLAPHAELDLTGINNAQMQQGDGNEASNAIYICSTSTLKLNSLNFYHGNIVNDGTITANNLKLSDGALLYNNGTVDVRTGDGWIQIYNTDGEIVNNGTLKGKKMTLDAGAKFFNTVDGNTTIEGPTIINNVQDSWMNSGTFICNSFSIDAQAEKLYNNCRMTVNGNFHMCEANSKFVLQGDASLVCESFTWKQCRFYMGSKALLKVKGTLYSENQNSGGFGFHGPSGSNPYAVIQAKKIDSYNGEWGRNQYAMAYFGNLYVDAEEHFEQGGGNPQQPWIYYDNSVKFSFTFNDFYGNPVNREDSPVSIKGSEDGCSPGYNDDGDDPDPDAIRVICEDLSVTQASDWDFNDVVFDVKLVENNSKVQITLRAAGGTLLLTVAGKEVHEAFKEKNPTYNITSGTMVSTGTTNSKGKYHYIGLKAPVFTIDNNFGTTNVKEIAKAIPVQVYKLVNGEKDWFDIEWKKGDPSARIGVGTDYNWCDERVDIRDNFEADIENTGGRKFSTFQLYVKDILSDNWYKVEKVTQAQVEEFNKR